MLAIMAAGKVPWVKPSDNALHVSAGEGKIMGDQIFAAYRPTQMPSRAPKKRRRLIQTTMWLDSSVAPAMAMVGGCGGRALQFLLLGLRHLGFQLVRDTVGHSQEFNALQLTRSLCAHQYFCLDASGTGTEHQHPI